MTRTLTIKDALKLWEEKTGQDSTKAKDIGLQFQWLPIEKMDSTLGSCIECRKLSLSSNMIEKISGISSMKNLRIISLARNYLKTLNGIESLAETLEQLWVSYNLIEKIKPVEAMKALKVLYISNNAIKDWVEFSRMNVPPRLEEVTFMGNPLSENMDETSFRNEAIRRLQNLRKLDGDPVIRGD